MSADYLKAVEYSSTFLRIGSSIFVKEFNLLKLSIWSNQSKILKIFFFNPTHPVVIYNY